MKDKLLALSVAFSLVACGGSGGDGSASSQAPAPAPSPSPANCANSPTITDATSYLGVLPTGQIGEFHFDTAARTAYYTVASIRSDVMLARDDASCSYTASATGTLRTSFLSNGLAVSAASVSGQSLPAMLVTNPETSMSVVAGTYNLLGYEHDQEGSGTIRSTYATFNVDTSGQWRLCPAAAYSTTCTGASGSLVTDTNGGFDLVTGGATIGRLLPKATATGKVLVMAITDTSDPSTAVDGIWIGASNTAFTSGAADGVYVTNTTDSTTSLLTLSGLTDKPQGRPTAAPILANQPVQGVFSIVTGDPADDIGIATVDGLYVDVTQSSAASTSFMRLGVRQIQ